MSSLSTGNRNRFAGGDRVECRIIARCDDALVFTRRAHEKATEFQIDSPLQCSPDLILPGQINRLKFQASFGQRQRRAAPERVAHRLREL